MSAVVARHWRAFALLLCLNPMPFVPALAAVAGEPATAREWLERMGDALAARTYDGEFLQLAQGQVERMRILHSGAADGGAERLVSLSGSAREVVRNDAGVYCYLPDQRRVLVESRDTRGPLLGTLPHFNVQALEPNYVVTLGKRARSLLGTPAQIVDVRPRDRHRFGYRLWIDSASGMPVRSDLFDIDGTVLEQVLFIRLDFPRHLTAAQLKTQVDASGYTYVNQSQSALKTPAALPWGAARLPPGFQLLAAGQQLMPGDHEPAMHLVLSDGLATVSVFVEHPRPGQPVREGQGVVGSAYAMSLLVGGERVTAIGEVPPDTVRLIASAIESAAGAVR